MFEKTNQLLINFKALIPEFRNEINIITFYKKKKYMIYSLLSDISYMK